jgi:cell division protein FtsI/penicillin-binding protein 2
MSIDARLTVKLTLLFAALVALLALVATRLWRSDQIRQDQIAQLRQTQPTISRLLPEGCPRAGRDAGEGTARIGSTRLRVPCVEYTVSSKQDSFATRIEWSEFQPTSVLIALSPMGSAPEFASGPPTAITGTELVAIELPKPIGNSTHAYVRCGLDRLGMRGRVCRAFFPVTSDVRAFVNISNHESKVNNALLEKIVYSVIDRVVETTEP